jgi:hypothetical protein
MPKQLLRKNTTHKIGRIIKSVKRTLKDPEIRIHFKENNHLSLHSSKTNSWISNRNAWQIGLVFENIFNQNFISHLKKYHTKKDPIKIFDDGAGQGILLDQLKRTAEKEGYKVETTGIVKSIKEKEALKKKVNKAIVGNTTTYAPKENYDYIFSTLGGYNYTIYELRKPTLLKYAYSLKKGGIALFGFHYHTEVEKEEISELLEKLNASGFRAYTRKPEINEEYYKLNMPKDYIVIKRMN